MKHLLRLLLFLPVFCHNTQISAQWESLNGPYGGWILDIFTNTQYAYLYTSDGIYRSADGGLSWQKPATAQQQEYDMRLLDANDDQLLAYSAKTTGFQSNKFLHVSENGGDTWSVIPLPDTFPAYPEGAAIVGQRIIVSDYEYILESSDGGATWINSPLNQDLTYSTCVESDGQRFYLAGYEKIAISDVGGNNFSIKSLPTATFPENLIVLGSLILMYDLSEERFYRSLDDGASWQASAQDGFGNSEHQVALFNGALYTMYAGNLAFSTNQGLNWTILQGLPAGDEYFNYIAAHGGALLSADYITGILRATDPNGPWLEASYGLANSSIQDIEFSDDYLFAGANYRGLFRYNLAAAAWDTTNLLPTQYNFGDAYARDGKLFVAREYPADINQFTVGVSTDNAVSWNGISPPGFPFDYNYDRIAGTDQSLIAWYNGYAASPFGGPIQKSDDDGATWYSLATVFGNQIDSAQLLSVTTKSTEIWGGTSRGVAYSPDNGVTWVEKNNGLLLPPGSYPTEINAVFIVDSLLFAFRYSNYTLYPGQMFVSDDYGSSWKPATSGLPMTYYYGPNVSDIVRFEGNLIASTDNGLYFSKDEGHHWAHHPGYVPDNSITAMEVRDSLLYIATGYRGVWRGTVEDFSIEKVSGRVFWDDNNNGVQDAGEQGVPGMVLYLNSYNLVAVTDSLGDYEIYAHFDGGNYSLKPSNNNLPYTIVAPDAYNLTGGLSGLDFAVTKTPGIRDLSVHITNAGAPRPGFEYYYYINACNYGTTEEDALAEVVLNPTLGFVSAEPIPDLIFADTLRWTIANFGYLASTQLKIKVAVPVNTPLGTQLSSAASITPADGDVTPGNNSNATLETVVGSYDPNDKHEVHSGSMTRQQIDNGEDLVYTVRFQNTGTYLAEKVVVTDQLDPAHDAATFRVIGASHPFTWSLRGDGQLEFVFDMINLPDSTTDQAASNGFVKFAVKVHKEIPHAYQIPNFAAIYFDYNSPILTNNWITKITEVSVATTEPAGMRRTLDIAPNPGTGWFTLKWPSDIEPAGWLQVFSQNGQLVWQGKTSAGNSTRIDLTSQPEGAYFVIMGDKRGRSLTGKLILLHR